MNYLCVSYAAADGTADRFFQELTRYGFRYQSLNQTVPRSDRLPLLSGAMAVVVLTSSAAEDCGVCASDIRYALGAGRPVICVSLEENRLDTRFCLNPSETQAGAVSVKRVVYPVGEAPDLHTVASYIHQLYVSCLCRLTACHSAVRCVDDRFGRTVKCAAAAHAGQTEAQLTLGRLYEQGEGVPQSDEQAAYWFSRAAAGGAADAMIRLGEYKIDGKGTPRDPDGALALFRKAAEAGDARGFYHEGLCSLEGYGMMRDPEQAVKWLERAAGGGYAQAHYRLALLCRDGVGTAANWRAAVRHLRLAYEMAAASPTGGRTTSSRRGAAAGAGKDSPLFERRPVALGKRRLTLHHISMRRMREVRLGRLLFGAQATDPGKSAQVRRCMSRCHYRRTAYWEEQWLAVPPDPSRDFSLLSRTDAYSRQVWDVSMAAGALGQLLEEGSPAEEIKPAPLKALRWYRLAIAGGHSEAMFCLGDCYRRGLGVPRDSVEAVRLYRRAADLKNRRGQFALAVCYEQGDGVRQDAAAAVHWYKEAAGADYAPAQNNLGGCYARGFGVPRDMVTATEWFMEAASRGQPDAACRLGICYEEGEGVPQDVTRAFRLYEQAARTGHPYALYRLGLCYDRYDRSDRSDREVCAPARFAYAVHLYRRAAAGGVAVAAYAMGLCCRDGRGVRRDGQEAFAWFRQAGQGGSVQGAFEAGYCLLEGRNTLRNTRQAVACFQRAAELWRWYRQEEAGVGVGGAEALPAGGLTVKDAAGSALYLWGYCTLYGLADPAAGETKSQSARRLFEEAADIGHCAAATALGDMYAYHLLPPDGGGAGTGETAAMAVAQTWYKKALSHVELGVEPAMDTVVQPTSEKPVSDDGVAPAPAEQSPENPAAQGKRESEKAERVDTVEDPAKNGQPVMQPPCPFARRGQADASMSLYTQAAAGDSEEDWRAAWAYLIAAARTGLDQALIAVASRVFFGRGQSLVTDKGKALRMLWQAAQAEGGSPAACLWLGDFTLCGWAKEAEPGLRQKDRPRWAEMLYRRALEEPSANPAYVIRERWEEEQALRARAQSQAMYRLAVLSALRQVQADEEDVSHTASLQEDSETSGDADTLSSENADTLSSGDADTSAFAWLCRAILSGHTMAREDLARMYQRAIQGGGNTGDPSAPVRWMMEYYSIFSPEPQPFAWDLVFRGGGAEVPEVFSCPVTAAMTASAMNYLGECLFEGKGLPQNRAEAVRCYRYAASIQQDRGQPVCDGMIWAQYNLGWCLLHGAGTPKDEREAVSWLSRAAKYNGYAAHSLAECYKHGQGVDVADDREALKYYRKAQQLGYRPDSLTVRAMERQSRKKSSD